MEEPAAFSELTAASGLLIHPLFCAMTRADSEADPAQALEETHQHLDGSHEEHPPPMQLSLTPLRHTKARGISWGSGRRAASWTAAASQKLSPLFSVRPSPAPRRLCGLPRAGGALCAARPGLPQHRGALR